MARLLYALAALMLLLATPAAAQWFYGGGTFATDSSPSFVSLADSEWGTGQTYDYTDQVFMPPFALDEVLGETRDTTGWTSTTLDCDGTDAENFDELTAAITTACANESTAPDEYVINIPASCTMSETMTNGGYAFGTISRECVDVVIRGDATDETVLTVDSTEALDDDGIVHKLLQYDSSGGDVATYTWTAGFDHDDDIVTVSGLTGMYAGDLVAIQFSASALHTGTASYYKSGREVVCAQWDNGITQGPTACTDTLSDNQIKLDAPVAIDATGSDYGLTFSTPQILHISVLGDSSNWDSNVPTRVAFENIHVISEDGIYVSDYQNPVNIQSGFRLSFSNFRIVGPWANRWFFMNGDDIYSTLFFKVYLEGPQYQLEEVATVDSLTAASPTTITASSYDSTIGASGRWADASGNDNWVGQFHHEFGTAGSRNREYLAGRRFITTGVDTDGSDNEISFTAKFLDDDSNIDCTDTGSGACETDPSGTGSSPQILRFAQWNISSMFLQAGPSDTQIINSVFKNSRVGVLFQQGVWGTVLAYNYFATDEEIDCSRDMMFNHGSGGFVLVEGNQWMCGFVTEASSAQGEGYPVMTFFRNRGEDRTKTHGRSDQCGGAEGSVCNETRSHTDPYNWHLYLGNTLQTPQASGSGGTGVCTSYFDNCAFHRNLWPEGNPGTAVNSNATQPDIDAEANFVDSWPGSWSSVTLPTSILYDRYGAMPSWASSAAIGADVDDAGGTNTKLPAQTWCEDEGLCP